MCRSTCLAGFLLAALLNPGAKVVAGEAPSIADAFRQGKVGVNFRYRLESVAQDGITNDALASTLRSRLSFTTAAYKNLSLVMEADNVSVLGNDKFNSTRNGHRTYPVVADPTGTDVNQFNLSWQQESLAVTFGRQRINHDTQRFVGGVAWRQNEQTYDSLRFKASPMGVDVDYAFVNRVSRIFGPQDGLPPRYFDSASHLLNLAYRAEPVGKLTAYVYHLDFDNAANASSRTFGIRYSGDFAAGQLSIPVVAEYATQQDAGNNRRNFDLAYQHLAVGVKSDAAHLLVGREVLEGDGSVGFSTPLATLHKFQGFADKFLATPVAGVSDTYITLSGQLGRFKPAITYHEFTADLGSLDYGSEIDAVVTTSVGENLDLMLKFADYSADSHATDTRKFWLMATVSF